MVHLVLRSRLKCGEQGGGQALPQRVGSEGACSDGEQPEKTAECHE